MALSVWERAAKKEEEEEERKRQSSTTNRIVKSKPWDKEVVSRAAEDIKKKNGTALSIWERAAAKEEEQYGPSPATGTIRKPKPWDEDVIRRAAEEAARLENNATANTQNTAADDDDDDDQSFWERLKENAAWASKQVGWGKEPEKVEQAPVMDTDTIDKNKRRKELQERNTSLRKLISQARLTGQTVELGRLEAAEKAVVDELAALDAELDKVRPVYRNAFAEQKAETVTNAETALMQALGVNPNAKEEKRQELENRRTDIRKLLSRARLTGQTVEVGRLEAAEQAVVDELAALDNAPGVEADIESAFKEREQNLTSLGQNIQSIEAELMQNPTAENYSRYQAAVAQYNQEATSFNNLLETYKSVSTAYDDYSTYMDLAKSDASKWKIAGDTAWSGVSGIARAFGSTLDFILPAEWWDEKDPLSWSINTQAEEYQKAEAKRQESVYGRGGFVSGASDVGKVTVEAVPNAIVAMMTLGGSLPAQASTTALRAASTGGRALTMFNLANQTVKNPMYWSSMAQTLGPSYEQAIENGASDAQAAAAAIISSALNAGVEVGGGIEVLPAKLRNGDTSAVLNWVMSMPEEGLEEVVQRVVSGLTDKAIYDYDKPLASFTDPDAIINPGEMGKEFAMGSAVAGALGSVQTGAISGANAIADYRNNRRLGKIGGDYQASAKELIEEGLSFAPDTEAHKTAREVQAKMDAGETVTDADLGRVVVANERTMQAEEQLAQTAEESTSLDESGVSAETDNRPAPEAKADTAAPVAESDPIMEAAREAVGAEDAKQSVPYNVLATDNPERQARTARVKSVQEITGYGEHGASSFTNIVETTGEHPGKVQLEFQSAYEAGRVGLSQSVARLDSSVRLEAYNAGRLDAIMAMNTAKARVQGTVIRKDAGFDQTNLPKDVTSTQAKAVDMLAKATGVRVRMAKGLKGNAEIAEDGTVLIDESFEREVNGKKRSILFYAAHEIGMHRLMQLAPEEGQAFINAVIQDINSGLAYGQETATERWQAAYAKQDVYLSTGKAMEEVSADSIYGLYDNEDALIAAIEKVFNGTDEKAKQGARKFKDILDDIVRKLKQAIAKLTGKEKAEARQVLTEVESLRDLFEKGLTAATERVKAEGATKNAAQEGGGEVQHSASNEKVAQPGKDVNTQHSLKDDPTQMERDLNDLRRQRTELQDEIDGAYLDDLPQADISKLENRMYKLEADIDKLVAQERRAVVKTSMNDILSNLSAYRRSDLESLAEQIGDGNWDDYEDLSRTELEEALREAIEGRELNALEMQSAKHGLYVRPVSMAQFSLKAGDEGATYEENGTRYSLKSLRHDIAEGKMFDDLVAAKVFTDKEVVRLRENLEKLISYMVPNANILDMNEEYTKDNRPFSSYKPNSDPLYLISLDFSTLCRKRLMTQYVIEQLQLRENRPMSAEEQIAIRSMLLDYRRQEKALQVACAMCYVEAARLKAPKQIERFFNDTESIMRKYFAKKDKDFNAKVVEAQKRFKVEHGYDENAPKKDMKSKDQKALNDMSAKMRKEYVPGAEQRAIIDKAVSLPRSTFLTAANLTALSIDHPEIYDAYTSHIRASTRSKSLEGDVPYYYGDSQGRVSDAFIDSVNAENGMRFDSWSDFQMKHMLDMITAVIDLSVRGSKMHGYTKFPEMVRIFGKTGMMFNLSGVTEGNGFDADGNLRFSDTESIDIEQAIKLRNEFPETAGLQCIGVSNDHIRALLRADYIDYVIPYHTSGMNATLRRMAGIHKWKDYTKTQHATPDPKAKKPANADKWHVEPVWSEFYVADGKDGIDVMKKTAQRYIDMCHERGLLPKFNDFIDEDGYWKLLVDRKMVNQKTGKIIEQQAVKPIFDFDLIQREIDREVSNYDPELERRALKYVVDNFDAVHQRIRDLKKGHPKKSMMKMGNEILQAYAEGSKQHSLKGMDDLLAENAKLKEVNQALREQFAVTKFEKADKKAMDQFTKNLLKDWKSGADINETRDALNSLYTFVRESLKGDDPDFAELEKRAYEVAVPILESVSEMDDAAYQEYKALRDHIRTTGIKFDKEFESDLGEYESLNEFRKAYMGRIKLTHDGLPVDAFYQELAGMYPGLFDDDTYNNPASQLQHIGQVLDDLRPTEVNPYSHNMRETATWLAADIIQRIYDLPQAKPTFADKMKGKIPKSITGGLEEMGGLLEQQQASLEQAETEGRQVRRELEEAKQYGNSLITSNRALKREIEQMKAETAKIIEENREKMRERAKKSRETGIKYANKKHRESMAKASTRKKEQELRARVIRHAEQMSKKLLRGTDKSNVPEGLKGAVAELLSCINLESNRTYDPETGSYRKNDEGLPTRRTEEFRKVREQYEAIAANNEYGMVLDPNLLGVPTEGIPSMLDKVIAMKDTRIVDMNLEQLQTIYDVLRVMEHSIQTAGKMLTRARWATIHEAADHFMEDTATRRTKRALTKNHKMLDIETPYTFFAHYGDAGTDFFHMLLDAQDAEQTMLGQLTERQNEVVSLEDRKKAEKETVTYTTQRGVELTLSKAHVMNIYLLNNRKQAQQHLLSGGIVQPEVGKIRKGTEAVLLTEWDVANIIGKLTDKECSMADGLQKLTLMLAEWGNKASMTVYGIKKFNDPDYWTIKSSDIGINQTVEQGQNKARSIANMGSAKAVIPEARNTLDIGSVFEVFDQHASDMMCYSAWLAPMEDANRLFNYKYRDENWNPTGKTIKGILDRVGGEGSTKYWLRLMEDIQNGLSAPADTATEQGVMKAIGNVKKAAVSGNIRVVIQQPTAFTRAAVVLGPDVMLAALGKNVAIKPMLDGWNKAVKHAPIAARKAAGGYEIASNPKQLAELLYQPRSKMGKTGKFMKDFPLAGAALMDQLTWGTIWNACEMQVARNNKALKKDTDEFYDAVKKLFRDVIIQTQVVDGVLQRSQAMRSGSNFMKQMTSFTGEPTQGANMIIRAYDQLRYEQNPKKRGKAIKKLSRAVSAYMFTAVLNAFAQSLVDGLRDDDDEKEYWEKVWAAFSGINGKEETWWDFARNVMLAANVTNNMNPMSWVPVWKDVLSILQGYSVERMDAASLSDFFDSLANVVKTVDGDGKYTTGYAGLKALTLGHKLLGGSSYNFLRDIEAIVRTFQVETDDYMARYETMKLMTKPENNLNEYAGLLYKAYQNDQAAYKKIYNDLVAGGVDAEKIKSKMEGLMKKEQGVKKVEELDQRYLSPDLQPKWDSAMSDISGHSLWKNADEKERDALEAKLYDLVTESKDSEEMRDKIREGASYGLDETEYLLYTLALDMYDQPNKNGEYGGTPTAREKADAIIGVFAGENESAYLWGLGTTSDEVFDALDAGVDIYTYMEFKAGLSELEAGVDYKKGDTRARKDAVNALLRSLGLDSGDSDYKWLYHTEYKK